MARRIQHARCLGCDYDLLGLAPAGKCPECGQEYDLASGMGVKSEAAAAMERGDRIVLWFKVGVLGGLGVVAMAVGGYNATRAADWTRPLLIGVGVGGTLLALAALVWCVDVLERKQR